MILEPGRIEWIVTRPGWRIGFSTEDGEAFAHAEITEWNRLNALQSRVAWAEFQRGLTDRGFQRVFCVIDLNDAQMLSFAPKYGFIREPQPYAGHAIFWQDL